MRAIARLVAICVLSVLFAPGIAAAQWERTYTILFKECTQPSLATFDAEMNAFPGRIDLRPIEARSTSRTVSYTSALSPNDLLRNLYAMVERTGYRARIGVEGLRYGVTCLPGRRRHPLATVAAPPPLVIYDTACGAVLEMTGDVLFDFGQSYVRADAVPTLTAAATEIAELRPLVVEVTGHTDSIGSVAANQQLSERRALAVMRYLQGIQDLRGQRFVIRGAGELAPRVPNVTPDGRDDPRGRQLNRRVEIFLRTRDGGVCG